MFEPITAFFMSTIAGNLIMGVVGETTAENVIGFWDKLNLGNHDLQNALNDAYKATFSSLEISLNSQGTLAGFLQNVAGKQFLKTKGEKELAKEFAEKVLNPFVKKMNLDEKMRDAFLKASRKSCRFFQKKQDEVLNFQKIFDDLNSERKILSNAEASETKNNVNLANQNARETYFLIQSILFTGYDLAEAPDLEKSRKEAGEVIYMRLLETGGKDVKGYFSDVQLPENIFFDFLMEQNLFLNGLVFNLELAIKNNQKVANIIKEYRDLGKLVDSEMEKRKSETEHIDLIGKISKLEQAIILTNQAGLDVSALTGQLEPLKEHLAKTDAFIRRLESWENLKNDLKSKMSDFELYFGDISGQLDVLSEMAKEHDEKLDRLTVISEDTKDRVIETKARVDEAIGETVKTREEVTFLAGEIKFLRDLIQNLKSDISMGDVQKQNLVAGIDSDAGFDIHSIYDFEETRQFELGRGAVGTVYRAVHRGTGKKCALKMIKEEFRHDASIVTRFLREGAILKGLSHPNLVHVDEVGGGGKNLAFYIQMELLEGRPLRNLIDEKKLPKEWESLSTIAMQIISAVAVIHKNGIVHRDINPNNVMILEDGKVKLMDFGVARIIGLSGLTQQGQVLGTSSYMSPEQRRGELLDYRSDIYSIGLILYELFTYRLPELPIKTMLQYNRNIPVWADSVVFQCLSEDKNERMPSSVKLLSAFKGEGADLDDIKKYEENFYVFLEDGKISSLEENKLKGLRKELSLPEEVWKSVEEKVRKRVLDEKLMDAENCLKEGRTEEAREHYAAALNIEPRNEKAKTGLEKSGGKPADEAYSLHSKEHYMIKKDITGAGTAVLEKPVTLFDPPGEAEWRYWREYRQIDNVNTNVIGIRIISSENTIVIGGQNGLFILWDNKLEKEKSRFETGENIQSFSVSKDLKYLIAGVVRDWSVRIYSLESGKEIKKLMGHVDPVYSTIMLDKRIISSSADGTIRIWDLENDIEMGRFEGHAGIVYSLAVSPDERYVVSAGQDKTIRVWDLASGKEIRIINAGNNPIVTVFITNDQKYIISGGWENLIKIWEFETGKLHRSLSGHVNNLSSITVSTDDKYIISGSWDRTVRIWDFEKGIEIKKMIGHAGNIQSVCISTDNNYIVSTGFVPGKGSQVKIWKNMGPEELDESICLILKKAVIENIETHIASNEPVYNWDEWGECSKPGIYANIISLFPVENESEIAVVSNDNTIRIIDIEKSAISREFVLKHGICASCMFSDKKHMVIGGSEQNLYIYDTSSGNEIKRFSGFLENVTAVEMTFGDQFIVTGSQLGILCILEAESGKKLLSFEAHNSKIWAIRLSKDNRYIISGDNSGNIKVLDFVTLKEERAVKCHTNNISSLALTPDGKYIIVGVCKGHIKILEFETLKEIKTIIADSISVNSLAVTSDGKYIISGGYDKNVVIWDFITGNEIRRLIGHTGNIRALCFHSGLNQIISGGDMIQGDASIRVWGKREKILERETFKKIEASFLNFDLDSYKNIISKMNNPEPRWNEWKISGMFEGHKASVIAISLLENEKKLITASQDNTIRIWDIASCREEKVVEGVTGLRSMCISNNGDYLATGHQDWSVKLRDYKSTKELKTLKGHVDIVTSLSFSYDDRLIITGSADRTARLWDVETGVELMRFEGHRAMIASVVFSRDNSCIVSGSGDNTVRVWHSASGKEQKCLTGHTGIITTVIVSNDNKYIISGSHDGSIRVWDIQTGAELRKYQDPMVQVLVVRTTYDDRYILAGGFDKSVRIFSFDTLTLVKRFVGHNARINSIALPSDYSYFISSADRINGLDCPVKLWKLKDKSITQEANEALSQRIKTAVNNIGIFISGKSVNAINPDWERWRELKKLTGHTGIVNTLSVAFDEKTFITTGIDKTLRIWDMINHTELRRINLASPVTVAVLSHDNRCFVKAEPDYTIGILEIESEKEILKIPGHYDMITNLAITADSQFVISGSKDGTIRLWDIAYGKELQRIEMDNDALKSLALSSDNRYLMVGVKTSTNHSIRVFDFISGKEIKKFDGHFNWITSLLMTDDNKYLISGGWDNYIRIFDFESGKESMNIQVAASGINSICLSSNQKYIVSAQQDKTIRIWDLETGKELKRLIGHSGTVNSVILTRDCRNIISSAQYQDWDAPIRIWGEQST